MISSHTLERPQRSLNGTAASSNGLQGGRPGRWTMIIKYEDGTLC